MSENNAQAGANQQETNVGYVTLESNQRIDSIDGVEGVRKVDARSVMFSNKRTMVDSDTGEQRTFRTARIPGELLGIPGKKVFGFIEGSVPVENLNTISVATLDNKVVVREKNWEDGGKSLNVLVRETRLMGVRDKMDYAKEIGLSGFSLEG